MMRRALTLTGEDPGVTKGRPTDVQASKHTTSNVVRSRSGISNSDSPLSFVHRIVRSIDKSNISRMLSSSPSYVLQSFKLLRKKRVKLVVVLSLVIAFTMYQDTLNFTNSSHHHSIYDKPNLLSNTMNSMDAYAGAPVGDGTWMGSGRSLRQGNNHFAKTPYVSPKQALNEMPRLQPTNDKNSQTYADQTMPSHIELCRELITRNGVAHDHKNAMTAAQRGRSLVDGDNQNQEVDTNQMDNSQTPPQQPPQKPPIPPPPVFTKYTVNESRYLCKDYKHPHDALMQIISSSIIAYVGKRFGLYYQHKCYSSIDEQCIHDCNGKNQHKELDFDITTVQQVFPHGAMPVNEREISLGKVVHNLCQSCIAEYNNQNANQKQSHQSAHHCLAFPRLENIHQDTIRVQQPNEQHPDMPDIVMKQDIIDSEGHLVRTGLGAILPLVKNRLHHAAEDWQSRARIPSHDPKSGAVIFFDAGDSVAVPFWILQQYVEKDATHISILTGSDCAKENLRMSSANVPEVSCIKYALELKDYFTNHYKDKDVEVSFNLLSSTATAYTRMIMSHTLVCLPGTITCFLPAIAKPNFQKSIILEISQQSADSFHWFTALGHSVDNIQVVTLNPNQLTVDEEQKGLDGQYHGFSINEIVGNQPPPANTNQNPSATNGNGASPPHQQVVDLNVATTTLNKSFAPKDHLGEGYQLLANEEENDTEEKKATTAVDPSSPEPTPDQNSENNMKSEAELENDLEDRFGEGSFFFGNNDSLQKVKETDSDNIDPVNSNVNNDKNEDPGVDLDTRKVEEKESSDKDPKLEIESAPSDVDVEGLFGNGR